MVAIGVAGELLSAFDFTKKLLGIKFNPTGFSPLDFRKKCLEIISAALIVVGLGLEVSAWPAHIKEVESLKGDNLRLQSLMQPRMITAQQHDKFVSVLKNAPKFQVWVAYDLPSDENLTFVRQIRELLDAAGFGVVKGETIDSDPKTPRPSILNSGTSYADGTFLTPSKITAPVKSDIFIVVPYSELPLPAVYLDSAFEGLTNISVGILHVPELKKGEIVVFVLPKQGF